MRIPSVQSNRVAACGGALIGILGGLIGLGGAEFRLPLLISVFQFAALEAIIMNKAMSLAVVGSALPLRATTVPLAEITAHWMVLLNLLGGSLAGAWIGAGWATKLHSSTLYRIIAILLVIIAAVLLAGHGTSTAGQPLLCGWAQIIGGLLAGFAIGAVASVMGVAGGEFLIPTLVLLFGCDIKLAGSLSLAVSLPTMLMGVIRYSRDQSFTVLSRNKILVFVMGGGSIVGSFIGERLLGIVSSAVLLPLLAAILLISAVKIWRHELPPVRVKGLVCSKTRL